MKKSGDPYFIYPSNLNRMDLATLVSMYRDRGIPKEAKAGEYYCCALTRKMIRNGKWWFGYHYSQDAWNKLLTNRSEGYPLTEIELNILGLAKVASGGPPEREHVEQHAMITPRLAYIIINDLDSYGFLSIDDQKRLMITPRGEKALQGIARRIYNKRFTVDMLAVNQDKTVDLRIERASRKGSEQADLF
jgi:predicted transcriptional regulator